MKKSKNVSLPDLLKVGLKTGDWTKIEEAYTLLTGEILTAVPIMATLESKTPTREELFAEFESYLDSIGSKKQSSQKQSKTPASVKKKPGRKPSLKNVPVNDEGEIDIEDIEVSDKINLHAPLGQLRKPFFATQNLHDEDSTKLNATLAKKTSKRIKSKTKVYVPHMIKCAQCGNKFDFKKEYPLGKFGDASRENLVYCNRCMGAKA